MFFSSHNLRKTALAISASLLCQQSLLAQSTVTETDTSTIAANISTTSALQNRVVALTQLIHYRFDNDKSLLGQRRSEVEAILSEWNTIDRPSPTDHQRMEAWLEVAIRSSMPGHSGKLPRPPRFGSNPVQHPVVSTENPAVAPLTRKPERVEVREVIEPIADVVKPAHGQPVSRQPAHRQRPAPRRSKWSRHPSAVPLKWSDPFSEEPHSRANPFFEGSSDRYETRRPTFGDGKGVTVDLAKLSAEVRGYNAALRSLGLQLSQKGETSTTTLTAIAAELERLETERRFLDLYREGLSDAEQKGLPSSPSAELVYEIVRRKTAKRLHRISPSKDEERRELEGLVARLARL